MKKVLAVFLAVLMLFSVTSVAVFAADPTDEPPVPVVDPLEDENTTRNIVNDEGLVVPVNETQLKFAFIVKIVEKVLKFMFGIFGQGADDALANGVKDFSSWLDKFFADVQDVMA